MDHSNFKRKQKITVDEIKNLTNEILDRPKVDLEISEWELYRASGIQAEAYHYNFDFGEEGIYELLEDKFCDKSTALIIYWLNQPLYYLNNPDSNHKIHDSGRKLKAYLEEKLSNGYYKEILQFVPIDFIEGPMFMNEDLNAKEEFLNEIPLEAFLPVGMNFNTTGTCNEINRYLKLNGIKTLYCFNLINTSAAKEIAPVDSLKHLNLFNRTKIKYAKISDLLHLKHLQSLRMDFNTRINDLERLSEFQNLNHLKINVGKEDYSFLSSLKNIKTLEFTSSEAVDLSVIEKMVQLESLVISGCTKLINVKGLEKLINLKYLKIEFAKKLKKLDGIFNLNLKTLIFQEVRISASSFKGLENMNLEILQLDSTNLKNIDFLKKGVLKELNLYNNGSNAELIKKITSMDLGDCKIIERNWNNTL